jgi:hypothetical protein
VTCVLDTGALLALERNDRELWAALKLAALKGEDVKVPSTVLAQAWRGGPRQARLSKALEHCVIEGFDPCARRVGELCGRTRTADICDAHVAIVAMNEGDVLYTSDPDDLRPLLRACGSRRPRIVPC